MAGLVDTGELDQYSQEYAIQLAKGYISEWPDQIREILMKQIASNFMKESQNIPGYDTNLIDKLFDYNRIVATTISHRRYQSDYSKAFDEMRNNHAAGSATRKYIEAWDQSADTPEHAIWRGARAVGFYNAMWGSFASSMVNAMGIWTVVAPQMMVMDNRAVADVYKNSVKLTGAIRLDKNIGVYINPDKIRGLSPDERAALNWAYKTGTVRAQINPELMGIDAGLLKTKGGKIGAAFKQYFSMGASVISMTEEMGKIAAFMTAYKYAQNPKALANWKKAFADNERAKAIMEAGSDPLAVAAFMTETTTFIGGQIEKAPILRGAGGVAFQFAQYPLQVAHLMYQNFAKMGPRGKQAGLFTLLTMFSVSGLLFAIPFGDDAINIFEWLTEKITGKKRDFRLETQQMLVDLFGEGPEAQRNAEALLYGPFRLLGLNIGERVGFSSMLPEMNNPITAIPALSGTLGKIEEYKNRKPDQPIGAYTALISPVVGKGVSDVMKGLFVFPNEGYRTQFGSNIKSPDEITTTDIVTRTLGMQSADIARAVRAKRAGEEINTGTAGAERNNTRRLGKMLADAIRLENKGDLAAADKIRAEFESEIQGITEQFQKDIENDNLAGGVKPPSNQALREAVMFDLYPETRIQSYNKLKRAAIIEARGDILLDGEDEFSDFEEEDEDEEGDDEAAFPQ
jgi:DNA-binding transcriptional regulator YhcF (GntR family)